jgi:hypothetical protein
MEKTGWVVMTLNKAFFSPMRHFDTDIGFIGNLKGYIGMIWLSLESFKYSKRK